LCHPHKKVTSHHPVCITMTQNSFATCTHACSSARRPVPCARSSIMWWVFPFMTICEQARLSEWHVLCTSRLACRRHDGHVPNLAPGCTISQRRPHVRPSSGCMARGACICAPSVRGYSVLLCGAHTRNGGRAHSRRCLSRHRSRSIPVFATVAAPLHPMRWAACRNVPCTHS